MYTDLERLGYAIGIILFIFMTITLCLTVAQDSAERKEMPYGAIQYQASDMSLIDRYFLYLKHGRIRSCKN